MSNIDSVNALLTAIHFDRFAEIEARHAPDALFQSFRGPTLRDSVSISDWHRGFLKDYADCNYTELEYIESGDVVAVRATLAAKGYDFRAFTQRVVEVFEFAGDGGPIISRHLYAMLPDLELDKPTTGALTNALESRGGSASASQALVDGFYAALFSGDAEGARPALADKAAIIDSVYGTANGPDNIFALMAAIPSPAFGSWRVTRSVASAKDVLVEASIDPNRPRAADWVRVVDGKIGVIESYWMLREIGLTQAQGERYIKQVILPI